MRLRSITLLLFAAGCALTPEAKFAGEWQSPTNDLLEIRSDRTWTYTPTGGSAFAIGSNVQFAGEWRREGEGFRLETQTINGRAPAEAMAEFTRFARQFKDSDAMVKSIANFSRPIKVELASDGRTLMLTPPESPEAKRFAKREE